MASVQVANAGCAKLIVPPRQRYKEHEAIHRIMDEMVDERVERTVLEWSYEVSRWWGGRTEVNGKIVIIGRATEEMLGQLCTLESPTFSGDVLIDAMSVESDPTGVFLTTLYFVSNGEFKT